MQKIISMAKVKRINLDTLIVTFHSFLYLFASLSLHPVFGQNLASDSTAVQAIISANGIPADDIFQHVIARNGRIEEFRLINLNLTTLPAEIGDLDALIYLDLSSNSLESLPEEIGNLQEVRTINLQNNLLSELPAGITNIPLTYTYQTTEEGCQITFDGTCIQYGPVLVTKTVGIKGNLGSNYLCDESPATTNWANAVDADWALTQACGSSVRSSYNGHVKHGYWLQSGNGLSIYNIEGQIVKKFPPNSVEIMYREFQWNGRNNQGTQVPTGFYFTRMESGRFHKILIVK